LKATIGSCKNAQDVSLTDSCIGWEPTERLLRRGYEKLAKVVAAV
jgi:3-deoxy-D-arabino-heptulosonate 7-phosphate (DAHP) synthase